MSKTDNSTNKISDNDDEGFSTAAETTKVLAVALGYQPEKDNAPKVLAKGEGFIAEKIIQTALDEGIEIKKDEDLLQILKTVDIDSEIPVEAFAAVAEIISYIYQANQKLSPKP